MKKAILLCGMLLAISATTALAGGLNLRWTNCLGDAGVQNLTFACNTDTGSRPLKGSFSIDADLAEVNGNELVFDISTASASLPDWWQFLNGGSCRQTALSIAAHDGA